MWVFNSQQLDKTDQWEQRSAQWLPLGDTDWEGPLGPFGKFLYLDLSNGFMGTY